MKRVASLQYGVVFKKAFFDPEIFSTFIRDLLVMELVVERVETEKEFDPPVGYINDLFAEDSAHRFIVDIQHARLTDHYDSFLYYYSASLLEKVRNSKDYHPKLKVFTVVVLRVPRKIQHPFCCICFVIFYFNIEISVYYVIISASIQLMLPEMHR